MQLNLGEDIIGNPSNWIVLRKGINLSNPKLFRPWNWWFPMIREHLHSLWHNCHIVLECIGYIRIYMYVCMYVCMYVWWMYVCSVALYHTSDRRLSLKNCHQKHLFKTLSHLWIIVKPCYTSVCWWSVHWWKKSPCLTGLGR